MNRWLADEAALLLDRDGVVRDDLPRELARRRARIDLMLHRRFVVARKPNADQAQSCRSTRFYLPDRVEGERLDLGDIMP